VKQGIHPNCTPIAFRDRTTGWIMITRSTLASRRGEKTVEVDGASYPVVDVDVTSDSHPFWTGKTHTLDTEGRLQAFERRYGKKS
jgi:large subunit ribosomal protein L31